MPAVTPSQSDTTTAYDRTWFWFNPRILLRVRGALYAGLDWDINYTRADDPGPVMLADPTFVQTGPEDFNHGIGAILQYDSRDVPVNAWRGTYFAGAPASTAPRSAETTTTRSTTSTTATT